MKRNLIYNLVLLMVIVAIGIMPFINVPISTSARGFIRPTTENSKIMSVVSGRIITSNLLNNNQYVKAGDTLLVITSEHLGAKKQLQVGLDADYHAQHADLKKLVRKDFSGLATGQYQKEVAALREKTAELSAQLALSEKDFSRAKVLFEQGVIPQADYDKTFFTYENLKSQVKSVEEQQMAQWQVKKREVERQLTTIQNDISQINIEGENYIIKAPVSGRLLNLSGVQQGNYMIQGQNIVEISADDNLLAECSVSPSDIGLIKKGQKVNFQLDAFNYNQWGLAEGTVVDIDQNLVTTENGQSFFRVKCTIDQTFLALRNGYKGKIQKGSTFTARFYLLDRTLWQLLFDRVDDWFNPNLM